MKKRQLQFSRNFITGTIITASLAGVIATVLVLSKITDQDDLRNLESNDIFVVEETSRIETEGTSISTTTAKAVEVTTKTATTKLQFETTEQYESAKTEGFPEVTVPVILIADKAEVVTTEFVNNDVSYETTIAEVIVETEAEAYVATTTEQTMTTVLETNLLSYAEPKTYIHRVQVPRGYGFFAVTKNMKRTYEIAEYNHIEVNQSKYGTWYNVPPKMVLAVDSELVYDGNIDELGISNIELVKEKNPNWQNEKVIVIPSGVYISGNDSAVALTSATSDSTKTSQTTSTSMDTANWVEDVTQVVIESSYDTAEITTTTVTETAPTTSTIVTTTSISAETTTVANTKVDKIVKTLPTALQQAVDEKLKADPNLRLGLGLYSLDGKISYEYNIDQPITSACSVKAAYANFVLEKCVEQGIGLDTKLTYCSYHYNNGSGVIIKNGKYGDQYTIDYLLDVLLEWSDNTAYNILVSKFSLWDFADWLKKIGGQDLFRGKYGPIQYPIQYGYATVRERHNEWVHIWNYIHSDAKYAKKLESYLKDTPYCYICNWISGISWLHKSGWCDGAYNSAADAAIVDDKYLLIIITDQDKLTPSTGGLPDNMKVGQANVVKYLGSYIFQLYCNGQLDV